MKDPAQAWWRLAPRDLGMTVIAAILLVVFFQLTYPPVAPDERMRPEFVFEVSLTTSDSGSAQVFFDRGNGFNQRESSSAMIQPGEAPVRLRFPLGQGTLRRLRFDTINGPSTSATIADPRIVEVKTGRTVREIALADFTPNSQVARCVVDGPSLTVLTHPGADDPNLTATFDPPLRLGPATWLVFFRQTPRLVSLFAGALVLGYVISAVATGSLWTRATAAVARSWRLHPRVALAATALASVTLCCHPVIFAGRSLFSPDYGLPLIHPEHADASSVAGSGTTDVHASDIGAMLWQHLPYSVVQHRAIVGEGALPLWNRYNSCGAELFGQGQSMLGDPFHLPVILAGGATWAWDLKFVVARFLFAWGAGLVAFAATRRLGPAALLAIAAPFIGFFSYRLNHPAYVTLCYSPWVLAGWLELTQAATHRRIAGWLAVVFVANWCLLTSGTVKEASMLAAALNLAGATCVATAAHTWVLKRRILLLAALLAVAGILMTAPWSMAFTEAVTSAWTAYDTPYAIRYPLARFAGLFDGMLYSEYSPEKSVYGPSVNFLILAGVLCLVARWRDVRSDSVAWACLAATFVALSLAFAVPWLPDAWILATPALRSIGHVGNTFSCVAIPLLFVLAAKGLAGFASAEDASSRRRSGAVVAAMVLVLLAVLLRDAWMHGADAAEGRTAVGPIASEHRFFLQSLALMLLAWPVLAVGSRWMQTGGRRTGAGAVLVFAALVPLLGRHGQLLAVGESAYFLTPAPRADLARVTPALDWLQRHTVEPARVMGIDGHLFAGYTAVHGLEGPNGPDAIVNRAYRELADAAGLSRTGDWYFPTESAALAPHQRTLDMLNVRYFVTCAEGATPPSWLRPAAALDLTILESPGAWPRAFFVDSVSSYETPAELVHLAESGDGRPFAAMLAGEAETAGESDRAHHDRRIVPATDYALRANETTFTVTAPGPGLAVLHETWLPRSFVAEIDGRPADILRVNHAFKGVRIERAGTYRIRFTFRPPLLRLSILLACAGLALAAATLAAAARARGPQSHRACGRS